MCIWSNQQKLKLLDQQQLLWSSIFDARSKTLYFESASAPSKVWILAVVSRNIKKAWKSAGVATITFKDVKLTEDVRLWQSL